MFQFPTFASFLQRMVVVQTTGLPHSDIPGSMGICSYPGLFAAYHVLLRLREPRHPPSALNYFLYLTHTTSLYFENNLTAILFGIKSARVGISLSLLYFTIFTISICNFSQHVKDLFSFLDQLSYFYNNYQRNCGE